MCARYALFLYQPMLPGLFAGVAPQFGNNYNVTPTTRVPVILNEGGQSTSRLMHWGLVPAWAKSRDAVKVKPVNARVETVTEKPMFRGAVKGNRCVLPMSGFFEWTDESASGKSFKQPWYISRKDGTLLYTAGFFDVLKTEEEPFESCALITTDPNEFMSKHHDRMPCFLNEGDMELWLDPSVSDWALLRTALKPLEGDELQSWPVTRNMSNARYREADSVEPYVSPPGSLLL